MNILETMDNEIYLAASRAQNTLPLLYLSPEIDQPSSNKPLTDDEIKDIMDKGLARAALGLAAVSPSGKLATKWGSLRN